MSIPNDDHLQFYEVDSEEEIFDSNTNDLNYKTIHLSEPLIVICAALVMLVIEKNISASAYDAIMNLLSVSNHEFRMSFLGLSEFSHMLCSPDKLLSEKRLNTCTSIE